MAQPGPPPPGQTASQVFEAPPLFYSSPHILLELLAQGGAPLLATRPELWDLSGTAQPGAGLATCLSLAGLWDGATRGHK